MSNWWQETIATQEELKAFAHHSSQTAALDYIISIESDVFIPSHSGNMARAVEGHRRFLGHLKTITPDRLLLKKEKDISVSLFFQSARLHHWSPYICLALILSICLWSVHEWHAWIIFHEKSAATDINLLHEQDVLNIMLDFFISKYLYIK